MPKGALEAKPRMSQSPSFAVFAQGDAYSTATKIMGRQAAGEGFVRGIGRSWPQGNLQIVTAGQLERTELEATLASGGFSGNVSWSKAPDYAGARAAGAIYFPAPPNVGMARMRNRLGPSAFSIIGITHTISSDRALDGLAALALPPFKPWDALICTSKAALSVVENLLEEVREELRAQIGAERFTKVQLPVIPLGINCDKFVCTPEQRAQARAALGLAEDEVAVLFAGRLSFHAKANPGQLYQALQAVSPDAKIVCLEAGLYPNDGIKQGFQEAQRALAPGVRFQHVPGDNNALYHAAWQASDIFTSLSDNVQETFGLTPVEAMAAGMPVIASDWNGYRDNVRHGLDGFLIPTLAPPPGAGEDLGVAVEAEQLSYDRQIGMLSLGVSVDSRALEQALRTLVTDPALRRKMGDSAREHALRTFDWPVVMRAYQALTQQLAMIRTLGESQPAEAWPQRADPFRRFAGFATRAMASEDMVTLRPEGPAILETVARLYVAKYAFDPLLMPEPIAMGYVRALRSGPATVERLLAVSGGAVAPHQRMLAWLVKFGIVDVRPPQ
jgi:glycosyltransferase involved in cell wall biosynthesis